ncbi:Protein phosphatase methylesterase 1 [Cryptotrichosporon argae]
MSDEFRRSLLNRLPPIESTRAPWAEPREDEDGSEELLDGLGALAPSVPSSSSAPSSTRSGAGSAAASGSGSGVGYGADFSPLSAAGYFDAALEVEPAGRDAAFRTYHAGGESVLVAHHGGGSGALSFAALAGEVSRASGGKLGVLTYDCRGHGKTRTAGSDTDLSLATLLADLIGVITHVFPDTKAAPSLILLGHSMGAAPVLSACPILQARGYKVPGLVVLDVVEGTAVDALPLMKSILAKRPLSFASVTDAIRWHVQSNSVRNATSARLSVPSILSATGSGPDGPQVWRTDLLATEPYWEEWYRGLSARFLASRCARLLVLAGQERLDKELMVGQMQGKFQLEVMQNVGHYLHEDDPAGLAAVLVAFWKRNAQAIVLPPKIGQTAASAGATQAVRRVGEA